MRPITWIYTTLAVFGLLGLFSGTAYFRAKAGENPASLPAIVEAASLGAPAEQAQVLDDGLVTLDEVNTAVASTAQCASDAGVRVEISAGNSRVPNSIGFATKTLDDGEVARAKLAECRERYLARVEQVFNAQNRPTQAQREAGWEFIRLCMADHGVAVPAHLSEAQLLQWTVSRDAEIAGSKADCVDRHYREFGYWP